MVNPCKKIERPINRVLDGIDTIVRGVIDVINLVITGINIDLENLVKIFNLGIELFNEYVGGFLSKFNDIMRDCNYILRLLVSISSGTIIGWFYLYYSAIITFLFDMLDLDMDLATLLTWVQYLVYLMLLGNVYNIVDYMSSTYSSSYTHTSGNCNTY